jgi:hypothetical protein
MTWRGLISRVAQLQVVLALLAVPSIAAAQANQADFQARFDRALVVFNSPRQPEAIPQFSQLIDDLRALRGRSNDLTTLLARALQYRAQARENVGQSADADADLRLIHDVAPAFRLTDPGLSPSLVNRFNAMVGQNARQPQPTRATAPGTASGRKPLFISGGYQYVHFTDCSDCDQSKGGYFDIAGDILPYVSWAGEVSGSSSDFSFMFFGAGARFHPATFTSLASYGQVLFGGVRESFDGFSESKSALHLSGGMDYLLNAKWGVRGGLTYIKAFESGGGFGVIRIAVGATAIIR